MSVLMVAAGHRSQPEASSAGSQSHLLPAMLTWWHPPLGLVHQAAADGPEDAATYPSVADSPQDAHAYHLLMLIRIRLCFYSLAVDA